MHTHTHTQGDLALTTEERPISEELQDKLAQTFKMLDTNDSGQLDMKEVKRALIALEVDEEELVGWGEEGSGSSGKSRASMSEAHINE